MNQPPILRTVFTEEQLQRRIRELGAGIAADFQNKELVLVAVLKSSVYFFADLTRAIPMPLLTDYIAIGMPIQSGVARITRDLELDVAGKHVIIVQDIVRTGLSLGYIIQHIEARCPAGITVCAMFVNPAQQLIDFPIAYQGYTVSSDWLMGYGMDYAEQWRHLPYVVEVDKKSGTVK